jgi:hypothetical protein
MPVLFEIPNREVGDGSDPAYTSAMPVLFEIPNREVGDGSDPAFLTERLL